MKNRYSAANLYHFLKSRYAPRGARSSYSQCGEDLVLQLLLKKLGVIQPFYVDIGAHNPIFGNNTYLFYRQGSCGIVIEPNKPLFELCRKKRLRDVCINVGVGREDGEAEFYMFSQSTRNTFSSEQAISWEKSSGQKPRIEKLQVLSLDTVVNKYVHDKSLDLLSIDAEGLDYEILSSYSWKLRPKVLCIEKTLGIEEMILKKGYILKAQILENLIYLDGRI